MKALKNILVSACLIGTSPLWAEADYKSMTVEDLVSWQRVTQQKITDNGAWVACKMEPWKGDATLYLYGQKGEKVATFETVGNFP